MNKTLAVMVGALMVSLAFAQQPVMPKPAERVPEDQFERKASHTELRGKVVILVYGDRRANDL